MADDKAKKKGEKSPRRTVASVGAELDELKAEVEQLKSLLAELSSSGAGVVAATAAAATAAATPAPAPAPPAKPMDAVHSLLREVFALAKTPMDEEDLDERDAMFERFVALVHSDRKGTSMLDQSLRNYTWAQLRKKADIYLNEDGDVGSYTITRQSPEAIGKRTPRVKLFLRARTRMPTPITLRRDDREAGAWRIEASSL